VRALSPVWERLVSVHKTEAENAGRKKHLNYAAVFFGHFTAPLFAGIASRHRSKEQKIMLNYDLCGNDVFKLAHASLALQFFLVGTSPWNPPAPST
jgi:hypothetical protein